MDLVTFLSVIAAIVTLYSAGLGIAKYFRRKRSSTSIFSREELEPNKLSSVPIAQETTGLPYWDVVVSSSEDELEDVVVARLVVCATTGKEAAFRAKHLIMEWNQITLGFELLTGKTVQTDDEGNPIHFIRPDLLPQFDGDYRELQINVSDRAPSSEIPPISGLDL